MAYKIFLGSIANQLAFEKERYNNKLSEIDNLYHLLSTCDNMLCIINDANKALSLANDAKSRYDNDYSYIFSDPSYLSLGSLKIQFDNLVTQLTDELSSPDYDGKTIGEWAEDIFNNVNNKIINAQSDAEIYLNNIKQIIGEIGDNIDLTTNSIVTIKSLADQLSFAMDNIDNELQNIIDSKMQYKYFTIESLKNNNTITFRIGKEVTTEHLQQISYSINNGETWVTTNNENGRSGDITISVTINENETILWKGLGKQTAYKAYLASDYWSNFNSTNNYICYGNVMSLLYGDNFINKTQFAENSTYNFYKLFCESYKLTDVSNLVLPATTLVEHCYECIFYHCTSLINSPKLPATSLARSCYDGMFSYCTSLTTPPELPTTTLADYCYGSMFQGCTALVNAPELPATTLAERCYSGMFSGCTSLVTAPELPATTLANTCYYRMFQRCTALTTPPELPATTLVQECYRDMFNGCTSLVIAPQLPATTIVNSCYYQMFQGCTVLNHIEMLANNIPVLSLGLTNWVDGVASTGTFIKVQGVTIPSGKSGIPTGWTVQEK